MTIRKLTLALHRYMGVCAGVLVALSGLTGSLLVFRDELDAFLHPELLRVMPGDRLVPLQAVMETLRQTYPHDRPLYLRLPRTANGVYEVWMNAETGRRVYIDPYTGAILGARLPIHTPMGFLLLLHTQLLSGEVGEIVIGLGALLLISLSVTGLVLWWPGRKKLLHGLRIKWRAGWKRLNYDVHKVVGILAMGCLILTAATGASMVFHGSFERTIHWLAATPPSLPLPVSTVHRGTAPLALDLIVRNANRALPGAETTWISLPLTPEAPVLVRKKFPQEIHPNGRTFIALDQYSGAILRVENALEAPLGTRILNLRYPMHIGRLGGLATRVVQVLVGLTPTVLFVTGLFIWWRKRRTKQRSRLTRPPTYTGALAGKP